MINFIEVTDPTNGDKVFFNLMFLLSVHDNGDGGSLLKIVHSGGVQQLLCSESYQEVKSLIRKSKGYRDE